METKQCGGPCGIVKPISGFYRFRPNSPQSGLMRVCKDCHKSRCEQARQALPKEKRSEINRRQRVNNIEGRKAAEKKWNQKRRDEGWFRTEAKRTYHKQFRDKRKALVFAAYGTICDCCGEDDIRMLTLDHLNNDGASERERYGSRGASQRVYARLIKENFPSGYRVLCFSCNTGRHIAGGDKCPHQLVCPNILLLAKATSAYQAA